MADLLDIVLLLALPASGKSEVRRYLAHLSPEEAARDFHIGPTVQLDDFPYVHAMRRIDEELVRLGEPRRFYHAPERPALDGRDWGTLIELVNHDYADLIARRLAQPASAAALLLERIDAAGEAVGIAPRIAPLPAPLREALARSLEPEAVQMLGGKHAAFPDSLDGRTLVIEFARGGPDGATVPLPAPLGYRYSLARLAPTILQRASILYVWVTPEESRRKNQARTDPNDPGSILHHGVPLEVMIREYGCDDMDWLEAHARRPGTVPVDAHGGSFDIPIARFDNRIDKTSFLRAPRAEWSPADVRAVHDGLRGALDRLARHARNVRNVQ